MQEKFENFNFKAETKNVILQANEIIEEYQNGGFDLTLRQLYYQFVARDLLPNSQKSYNRLGNIINDARLNGDIDWDAIKDRTRSLKSNSHWDNPADVIDSVASWYEIDTRADQDVYIEVWVEKEALAGVVERVCRKIDIPWFACRGYVSQTSMYEASKRFLDKSWEHDRAIILHLGDHDPSGIDMTRDISDRLNIVFGIPVEIQRIALNMEQVEKFSPPPNPAKLTDSRCGDYIKNYGEMSWELDALDPNTLSKLIETRVNKYTDVEKRKALIEQLNREKMLLQKCSENWRKIEKMLGAK